ARTAASGIFIYTLWYALQWIGLSSSFWFSPGAILTVTAWASYGFRKSGFCGAPFSTPTQAYTRYSPGIRLGDAKRPLVLVITLRKRSIESTLSASPKNVTSAL